jgi:hypothetical protein
LVAKGRSTHIVFHVAYRERRRKNRIEKMKREDGEWLEREEERTHIVDYFSLLFRSNGGHTSQELLNVVDRRVSPEMNENLVKEFTVEEVKATPDSIGDLKAPGPDGMPSIFYKKFWGVVGDRVLHEVLELLKGGPMLEEWNETTIVLIPKVPNPV